MLLRNNLAMEGSGNNSEQEDNDRMKALPDELLHHILSYSGIRAAVRMRGLSRRWRNVCNSMPCLSFVWKEFQHFTDDKFICFVNSLLLLRDKVDVHTFRLHLDHYISLSSIAVRMWISYAVKHNVKVLDVRFSLNDQDYLPPCIFTCHSLQELSLRFQRTKSIWDFALLVLPHGICLPSLKKLCFRNAEVRQDFLDELMARSPVLEDLRLKECALYFDRIDSKVLKYLAIKYYDHRVQEKELEVSCPSLMYLVFIGCPLKNISLKNLSSLRCAYIDDIDTGLEYVSNCNFIRGLSHAKLLVLFGPGTKVMLEKDLPTCSIFHNLTSLDLGEWPLTDDLYPVLHFLHLSPNLEKLTLRQMKLYGGNREVEAISKPTDGTRFQCLRLEMVEIQCSKEEDGIDKLVNILVANGIGMEKIHISRA